MTNVQIDWETANQIMAEIVTFLEGQGITMPRGFDYEGLAKLLHNKNGKAWSGHQQEWRTVDLEPK